MEKREPDASAMPADAVGRSSHFGPDFETDSSFALGMRAFAIFVETQLPDFAPLPMVAIAMNNDAPLAYFVTWTVYGTHLQGDDLGWRRLHQGHQAPQPNLELWHAQRLKHPILLLDSSARSACDAVIAQHCEIRGWKLWIANARTTHVHVVVSAIDYRGSIVRDQLKANCSTAIRKISNVFCDRPIWTVGGDWKCINTEKDLHQAIEYLRDAQDRKGREVID